MKKIPWRLRVHKGREQYTVARPRYHRLLRQASGYMAGLMIGGAVFGGVTLATTGLKLITAHYANIAIKVNGKTIPTAAEPFIYNANVYVPISTIGHGLKAKVNWDGQKRQVIIQDPSVPETASGTLNYDQLPVYSGTHTISYQGQTYFSPFALATLINQPFYLDSTTNTAYIGKGPATTGMPINAFFDVRDYGDYAHWSGSIIGPTYGWNDGAPKIDGVVYPNSDSLVWAARKTNSQVPGVEYNLNGNYTSLTGSFGIDDASDQKEQVQLTITGDGKQLYQSPFMQEGEAATPVAVNVTGVHLLTIALSVRTSNQTIYTMGQTLPSGLVLNVDFADVHVH